MIRTHIYLTEKQRDELASMARTSGRKQSELIREAIDLFIERSRIRHRESVLRMSAGIWKDRKDHPGFDSVRDGWDRKRS